MAQLFNMPQLGSTMEEGRVVLWNRREGEAICKGDVLLEVETDKTIVEVEAPCDGVLRKILAQPETRVSIHWPIAILGAADEDITSVLAGLHRGGGHPGSEAATHAIPATAGMSATEVAPPVANAPLAISPRARRLADEAEVPLALLAGIGTGPGGRVIERDVLAYIEAKSKPHVTTGAPISPHVEGPTAPPDRVASHSLPPVSAKPIGGLSDLALGLPGSRVDLEGVLTHASPSHPMVEPESSTTRKIQDEVSFRSVATMSLEVDMTACLAFRDQLLAEVAKTYGTTLRCIDIAVKATARAIEICPLINATLVGDDVRLQPDVNIAVSLLHRQPENGLVTSVVRNVESKTLGTVSAELNAVTETTCGADQEAGAQAAFSITALVYDIDRFDPAVPAGHVAALGFGRIAERPVALDGQIVARTTMSLCLAYHPQIVGITTAVRFLERMKELLGAPALILV